MKCNNLQLQDGKIFIQELDSTDTLIGVKVPFGGSDSLTLATTTERAEHYCAEGGDDAAVRAKDGDDIISQESILTIASSNITNTTLKLGNFATESLVTQASATGTVESIASAVLGGTYDTADVNISNLVVANTTTPANVPVLGVDYLQSLKWGNVTIIDGGNISAGETISLTYDSGATDVTTLTANTQNNKSYQLTFEGYATTGLSSRYVFPKVQLSLSGDQVLKAETSAYNQLTFEGIALVKGTEPIYTITNLE